VAISRPTRDYPTNISDNTLYRRLIRPVTCIPHSREKKDDTYHPK